MKTFKLCFQFIRSLPVDASSQDKANPDEDERVQGKPSHFGRKSLWTITTFRTGKILLKFNIILRYQP
jgi:hypothetical protein